MTRNGNPGGVTVLLITITGSQGGHRIVDTRVDTILGSGRPRTTGVSSYLIVL